MNAKDRALIERNSLFAGVDFSDIEYMLERCVLYELDSGEKLLQPEAFNHHLFLILDGEIRVHLIGQEMMEHVSLCEGECAGEVSLVDGKKPSALVVAARPTRVLEVPHDTVWSLLNQPHAQR